MDLNQKQQNFTLLNITDSRKVPLKSAWFWINEGFRYLMQGKLMWLMSLSVLASFYALSRFLPPIFQIVILIVFPIIAAGLAIACYRIENGRNMTVEYLFSGFTCPNSANLFRYGFVLFLLIIVAQIVSSILLTSMGITQEQVETAVNELKNDPNASFDNILASAVLSKMMVVSFITLLPVFLINLLAPIVLAFSNFSAWQTVALCFKAGFKNLQVFIVYAVLFFALAILPILLYNYLIGIIIDMFGGLHLFFSYIVLALLFVYIMFMAALSYCSAYVAFKDIFMGDEI